jgi:rod shape determining protein RodA
LLIGRGLVITAQAQTLFGKLLAGSLTMTFFVYVFVNIGMVSGLCRWWACRCPSLATEELRW